MAKVKHAGAIVGIVLGQASEKQRINVSTKADSACNLNNGHLEVKFLPQLGFLINIDRCDNVSRSLEGLGCDFTEMTALACVEHSMALFVPGKALADPLKHFKAVKLWLRPDYSIECGIAFAAKKNW